MSTEDNKALVRRLYAEVMGKGNMIEAEFSQSEDCSDEASLFAKDAPLAFDQHQ